MSPRNQVRESAESLRRRSVVAVRTLFHAQSSDYVVMVATVLFLVLFGLVMVLSSSFVVAAKTPEGNPFSVGWRQGLWAFIALPIMLVASRMPTVFWRKWAPTFMLGGLILQSLVAFTSLGVTSGGNTNWLSLGGLTGQPSEFLKAALVIWMAWVLSTRMSQLDTPSSLVFPFFAGVGMAIGLVLAGQDLGTAGIMTVIVLGVLFVAGIPLRVMVLALAGVAGAGLIASLVAPYRMERFAVWMSGCAPEDYLGQCWQSIQGTGALGSGGIFGVGLGNSRSKWSWLPEAETDFIYAVIGEELGLIGTSIVIIAYTVLAVSMVRLIRSNPDPFAKLVTTGMMVWITGQALVNIAVVLEYLPVLGVPLPFISSGGSALLAGLGGMGVVMSLHRARPEPIAAGGPTPPKRTVPARPATAPSSGRRVVSRPSATPTPRRVASR